jgi:hypothetical protein
MQMLRLLASSLGLAKASNSDAVAANKGAAEVWAPDLVALAGLGLWRLPSAAALLMFASAGSDLEAVQVEQLLLAGMADLSAKTAS